MPNTKLILEIPEGAQTTNAIKAACNFYELPESAANARLAAKHQLESMVNSQLRKEATIPTVEIL